MRYIVTHKTSRGQRFIMPRGHDTLEDAMADAKDRWEVCIDVNSHVSVKIEKQEK